MSRQRKPMAKTIKLHKSKIAPTYKYRLQELINELPKGLKISVLEKLLLRDFGITQNEFYRDRTARYGSDFSIPDDRMQVYAQIFDVTVDDLRNQNIKAKPLVKSTIKTPLR